MIYGIHTIHHHIPLLSAFKRENDFGLHIISQIFLFQKRSGLKCSTPAIIILLCFNESFNTSGDMSELHLSDLSGIVILLNV